MRHRRHFAVESLESRDTPGALTLATGVLVSPVVVSGYTDPNDFHSAQSLSIRSYYEDPNLFHSAQSLSIRSYVGDPNI